MRKYDHKKIEPKWQKDWEKSGLYKTREEKGKPKKYILDMFPYPSGEGLHVGHPKGYIATDIYSRYFSMRGENILHPMGWDAFGLPAENYALKHKVHPREAVEKNILRFKEQLGKLGFNYDWEREINTTDPEYYKWTQWIFLQMFKKGLAYESHEPINWCPSCKTGLALEDLEDGKCERCGSDVEQKPMRQWVLKIREYADRLLEDLDELEWPESVKESQRNWIGRSEGATFKFKVESKKLKSEIEVFTTRADTLFGVTYLVLAPEHPLVADILSEVKNKKAVEEYIAQAKKKTDLERTKATKKEKTGIALEGITAINPADAEPVSVWIADYVLAHYGTGAVMAVPAHDDRDFQFAKKYSLPMKSVVAEVATDTELELPGLAELKVENVIKSDFAHIGDGMLINSMEFNGMKSEEARGKIAEKYGEKRVDYKLRDWVFSRQRYWGEPIPIIHCEQCGPQPVPENELPVVLPEVEGYEPTGTGESPLAGIAEWVNTECPKCGGKGKRETNTMPQWAGSSWYYLRYIDPENSDVLVDKEKEKYWSPVDMYVGGTEHATRHLIYARFWHKFLFDVGAVNYKEPFARLKNQGLIQGEDGRKMSKRWGNVVNPDDMVDRFGADTLRVYEMFMGPFEDSIAWDTDGMVGARRFLEKMWRQASKVQETRNKKQETNIEELERLLHRTIKKVTEDIEGFRFNTAVSAMMIFINELDKQGVIWKDMYTTFLQILAPFAPHIAEELWHELGRTGSVHESGWPVHSDTLVAERDVTIAVQVDGRVRGDVTVPVDASEEQVVEVARKDERIAKWLTEGKTTRRIYKPGKILNFLTKSA